MKKIDLFSLLIGLLLGLFLAVGPVSLHRLFAEDIVLKVPASTNQAAKGDDKSTPPGLTQEEANAKLDKVLDSQKELQEELDALLKLSENLKASTAK